MSKWFAFPKGEKLLGSLVLAATAMGLVGCGGSSDKPKESETGEEAMSRQIRAIRWSDVISYIGDKRTGFCYAMEDNHYTGCIKRVPCTKKVLDLIPVPDDRPGYKPTDAPAPYTNE